MGVIQFSSLGRNGRLGNQLHQVSVARALAERSGSTLEIPDEWEGRTVFQGWDSFPPLKRKLPRMPQEFVPGPEQTNYDLDGYFQSAAAMSILSRAKLREWFKFKPKIESQVRKIPYPYCAWHLRLEDYLTDPRYSKMFTSVSARSYLRAATENQIDLPILTFSADWPGSWTNDFILQRDAAVLFRANSTFSWWAGVLGTGRVFSPVVDGQPAGWQDCDFVEGNWPKHANMPYLTDLHLPD